MNTSSPRDVRKAKQKDRLDHERDQKDLRDVLATVQGRRFVWKQLTEAGCFRLSFVPGEPDTTALNEGRRSLGLKLMADIHALDPALYTQMAREANDAPEKEPVEPTEPEPEESDHA